MKLSAGLAAMCAGLAAACASAPGIDRPMPLDAAYAVREVAAGKPADRCGPEFISDNLPKSIVALMGPLIDGPFRPVCARHDACYELREQTQAWCDMRMRTEMVDICNAGRSEASAGAALCRLRAGIYAGLVDNSFGAYSYHGEPGGQIAALEIAHAAGGNAKICVSAYNSTPLLQEYVAELRGSRGRRIDREPRFGERGARAGQTITLCLGGRDGQGVAEILLIADDPDSLAVFNDRIIVDRRTVSLAAREAN